jgi:hypothetical protein
MHLLQTRNVTQFEKRVALFTYPDGKTIPNYILFIFSLTKA